MTPHPFEGIDPDLKIIDEEADAKRWEGLNKKGEALTKETYESWTGELHNLLIFAGLFSAIITAFTIEANKTIQGEPIVMAVLLLQTIVLQLNNQSNPQANLPIDLYPETEPSLYSQRINALYSVSLALSLSAVLGGILCLQWLREFGKNITGVSNKEDVLLQHQRHESLRTWGVLIILNILPLFLLTALGLFFIGFMVSQWESKSLASIPVTSLVALCGGFIACTTVLPTCQFLFLVGKSTGANVPRPILCPYRSPQSWLFHLILQKLFLVTNLPLLKLKVQSDFWKALKGISTWLDYDIKGVKRWKENAGVVEVINESLLWVSREYRQATTVILDAYSCMVFASCYRARMKLKEKNASVDLEQDWEEHELSTSFKVKNNIQRDVIKWKWKEGHLSLSLEKKNNIQRDSGIKWEWEEGDLLTSFQTKNNINDTEVIQKIHAKAVIDATVEWHRSAVLLEHPVPLSDISALGKSISDEFYMDYFESSMYLLNNITTALRNSENTPEHAVAVTCHVIDQASWYWGHTVPILEELCKRPTTQSLPHIRRLCNKLRDKLSSDHLCEFLVSIFNDVFRSVDSAYYKDLAPILGRLLVKCDECFIHSIRTEPFLKIIEDLVSKRLIGKEHALDNIFLYTKHIIQHSWTTPEILPSITTTLNAILSAVEEYDDSESSKFRCYVMDRNKFTIPHTLPHPDQDEDLEPVWSLIDNFNKRLPKEVWGSRLIEELENTEDTTSIRTSEDLRDETCEVTSEILATEDLPVIAFAIPKALKSSQLEIVSDIGTGTATHSPPLSTSQDSKHHSSNNNGNIPIDTSATDEIPLVQSKMIGDSKIKNSS